MVEYYPPKLDLAGIVRRFPELEMVYEEEATRFEDVEAKKKRGKGAPKKQGKGARLSLSLTFRSV